MSAPPELSSANGATHYLATGAQTDGEFGLYKVEMGPKAPGPSTHFHRAISESFYVLDGEVTIFDGERWVTCRPGDFLYVPVGGLHAFRNASPDPASMLLLFTPGRAARGVLRAGRGGGAAGGRGGGTQGVPHPSRQLLRGGLLGLRSGRSPRRYDLELVDAFIDR